MFNIRTNMENNNSKLGSGNIVLNISSFSLGILLLLLSDALWVSSLHITEYYGGKNMLLSKPFFSTYIKGSMFAVYYMIVYINSFWKNHLLRQSERYQYITEDMHSSSKTSNQPNKLSNPSYVPLKLSSRSSGTESDDPSAVKTSVRFKKLAEVRHMSEEEATEAIMARMSHAATLRIANKNTRFSINKRLQCLWMSMVFSVIWILSNYMMQLSSENVKMNIKAIHCASLITSNTIAAAIFQTKEADRITFARLTILISTVIVLVTIGNWDTWRSDSTLQSFKWTCILAALGGMFNSFYLSLVNIIMNQRSKFHVSLLLGYAGLVISLCAWPVILLLDFTKWEQFEMPGLHEWLVLLLEGVIGTTISQLLWLCGSLLTSSSLAGVAVCLTIPLYGLTQGDHSSQQMYLSFILIASFCFLTLLTYIPSAFPFSFGDVYYKLRCIRNSSYTLQSEYDMEQRESLISENVEEPVQS